MTGSFAGSGGAPLREHAGLLAVAAAASLVLSALSVYLDDVINNDGVEYLRAAREFLDGNWSSAFRVYKWPFYSALIATVAGVTGFDLELSAHVLNAVLTAVLVVAFIAIVAEFGGSRSTLVLAALVILLFPGVNDHRPFVIRDPGYLCFFLVAVFFLARFFRREQWRYAAAWFGAMVVATLFRIEGVVFLMLLPGFVMWNKAPSRRFRLLGLLIAGPLALIVLSAFGWWMFTPLDTLKHAGVVDDPTAIMQGAWTQVSASIASRLDALQTQLLQSYPHGYAYVVLALTLLGIVLAETLGSLTPWFGLAVGIAVYRKLLFPVPGLRPLWYVLLVVNAGILLVFGVVTLFLTRRYPLALVLILLMAVPFALNHLYLAWRDNGGRPGWRRWAFPVLIAVIIGGGLEGLDLSTSKRHIKAAGQWLRAQTPKTATVYSNDKILIFYSGRPAAYSWLAREWKDVAELVDERRWRAQDYVAIRIRRREGERERELLASFAKPPVKIFANDANDRVLIFEAGSG